MILISVKCKKLFEVLINDNSTRVTQFSFVYARKHDKHIQLAVRIGIFEKDQK